MSGAPSISTRMAAAGLEPRLLVDVASVAEGIRELGLLHWPTSRLQLALDACRSFDLVATLGERRLATRDPLSLEYRVGEVHADCEGTQLTEVWISRAPLPRVPSERSCAAELGYPPCCVRRYEGTSTFRGYFQRYIEQERPAKALLNRLAALFSPSWLTLDFFPCRLDCELAGDLALKTSEVARGVLGEGYFDEATRGLEAPLLVAMGQLVWSPRWERRGDDLVLWFAESRALSLKHFSISCADRLVPFEHLVGVSSVLVNGRSEQLTFNVRERKWT